MQHNERLLRHLGETARASDPLLDGRWEALCRGELTAAEEAAFDAEMRRSGAPPEAMAAFCPLGPAAEERMAGRVMEVLGRDEADTFLLP